MDAAACKPLPRYVFRRTFDVPLDLVWAAWTEPARLAQWWGPEGFVNPRCEFEPRPDGKIHIDMTAPDGRVYPLTGRVTEIEPRRRLTFECTALGPNGRTLFDEVNEVVFEETADGGAAVAVHVRIVAVRDAAAHRYLDMTEAGWSESLERLRSAVMRR